MGNIHKLQGRLLPHTSPKSFQEISTFSCQGSVLPIQSTTVWSVHSTHRVHGSSEGGKTDGFIQGDKNPVPTRLVGQSQIPPNPSRAYTNSNSSLSGVRLGSTQGKIISGPQTSFRLRRLRVRSPRGQGQNNARAVAVSECKNMETALPTNLSGVAANVPDRVTNSYRKTGPPRLAPHEIQNP